MASTGKWEVVGRGKKRSLHDKKKEKFKPADVPKIDITNPVPEAETIYHAFEKHEKKINKKFEMDNNHFDPYAEVPDEGQESDKGQEAKKINRKKMPPTKPQKTEQQLLQEALQRVNLTQLKNNLAKDEASFPTNPSLWLKDMASYVHLQLQNVPEKDPVFEDKPKDYPSCLLDKETKAFIVETLQKSCPTTLDLFFQYCMNEMVLEMSRGHSVYGMQIMIQCTVLCCPKITVAKLEVYEEMLIGRKSRPREALAIMWSLGQLPENNLAQGMKVWTTVMMPVLNTKQLAKYAIEYLETLLRECSAVNQQTVLQPCDFFSVMALTFSSSSALAGNHGLQRKMIAMYPKLKAMSFGSLPQTCGRVYFPTLLRYLSRDDLPVEYLTEILECLTYCLEKDTECFSLWIERYPKCLQESSALLYHIVDTWTSRSSKVNKDKLQQAVSTFQVFNSEHEMAKQVPGFEDSIMACKAAEEKTKRSSCFSFKSVFKLFLVILIGVITYDVYKHHGYKGSKTAKFANEYGIEQGTITAYGHAKVAFDKGNSWVQDNYPTYYSKFREYADPAGKFAWETLTIAGNFITEHTKPAREYLNKKVPEVLEKVEKEAPIYWGIARDHAEYWWNKYWPIAHKYIMIVWKYLEENVPPLIAKIQELAITLAYRIYELAPDFFNSVAASMERLGQKISEKIPDVVAVVQEYAIIASNLAVNLVNSTVAWLQSLAASADDDVVVAQQSATSGPAKSFPK